MLPDSGDERVPGRSGEKRPPLIQGAASSSMAGPMRLELMALPRIELTRNWRPLVDVLRTQYLPRDAGMIRDIIGLLRHVRPAAS